MKVMIWALLLALMLTPRALAQAGSAHGFDSGMGEGGYMGMSWHSRTEPGPDVRELTLLRFRYARPAPRYYWDPFGGGGYLTNQWTTTPAGIQRQLWYDPSRSVYYYYP